jgi:SAM-dependent methyltransferase
MSNKLAGFHQAHFQEDIDFWLRVTRNKVPLLELGCGQGRVSIPLLQQDRILFGLDQDLRALRYIQEELSGMSPNQGYFIQADMLKIPLKAKFGVVIIPCNTYSTFPEKERLTLIDNIIPILRRGGELILSVPNPERIQQLWSNLKKEALETEPEIEEIISHPLTGNPIQVSSRLQFNEDSLGWEWYYDHLLPDGQVERSVFYTEHRLTQASQYRKELLEAGFEEILLWGDFSGAGFQTDSPYLIIQAILR